MQDLNEIMDGLPNEVRIEHVHQKGPEGVDEVGLPHPPDEIVAILSFSEKGFGFGHVTFVQTKDGLAIDTECMSRDRVKKYLCWLVDNAVTDTDKDPEKHALYDRIMQGPNPEIPLTEEEEEDKKSQT